MISFEDDVCHDGIGLATLVRSGKVSAAELLEAAIARIEAHNPPLNAVTRTRHDAVPSEAAQIDRSAPFAGAPFLVKDLAATTVGRSSDLNRT